MKFLWCLQELVFLPSVVNHRVRMTATLKPSRKSWKGRFGSRLTSCTHTWLPENALEARTVSMECVGRSRARVSSREGAITPASQVHYMLSLCVQDQAVCLLTFQLVPHFSPKKDILKPCRRNLKLSRVL